MLIVRLEIRQTDVNMSSVVRAIETERNRELGFRPAPMFLNNSMYTSSDTSKLLKVRTSGTGVRQSVRTCPAARLARDSSARRAPRGPPRGRAAL